MADQRVAAVLWISCPLAGLLLAACGGSPTPTPTQPAPVAPIASAPTSPLPQSNCHTLTGSGSFTLDSDVTCVLFLSNNEALDCQHHAINDHIEWFAGVSHLSLRNCTMTTLTLSSISSVTIADSTILNLLTISNSHGVVVENDRIGDPNQPLATSNICCLINLSGGGNNQILNNVLDGGYHGQCGECGADDGIIMDDESGDTIRGNTLSNVFDAGIEGLDTITNTTIADNTIVNAAFAGIGSYWCTHWQGNTVTGNAVSGSLRVIFIVTDISAACGPTPPSVLFSGNTIANNTITNPLATDRIGLVLNLVDNRPVAGGNVLRGNDAGGFGIFAVPASAFSDISGNGCSASGTITC